MLPKVEAVSVLIEARPIKVVLVVLEVPPPLPCKYRPLKDELEPLKLIVMSEVVLVALAEMISTRSVYVPGIELKVIVAAPPAPTVAFEISCISLTLRTAQKMILRLCSQNCR